MKLKKLNADPDFAYCNMLNNTSYLKYRLYTKQTKKKYWISNIRLHINKINFRLKVKKLKQSYYFTNFSHDLESFKLKIKKQCSTQEIVYRRIKLLLIYKLNGYKIIKFLDFT